VILGLAAGIGATVVVIVLMVNGTVKVGVGLAILFIGLPLIEGVLALVNSAIGAGLVLLARAIDRDTVEQWLPEEEPAWMS
jgi:hypothetical protein